MLKDTEMCFVWYIIKQLQLEKIIHQDEDVKEKKQQQQQQERETYIVVGFFRFWKRCQLRDGLYEEGLSL